MKMEYMGTEYVGQCPRRGYQSHMAADMVRTLGRRNGNDAFVVNQQRPNPGILKFQKRKAREKQREKKKNKPRDHRGSCTRIFKILADPPSQFSQLTANNN